MVFLRALPRKRSRRPALLAIAVGLGLLGQSCSDSGFVYVSSSDRNAYFKVPANWKFFDKREMLVSSGQSLSAESNRQLSWLIGYDADPEPSVDHILGLAKAPRYPVVEARVQQLPPQVRDEVSLGGLRNWVYPLDRLVQANLAEMLAYEDVVLEDGKHGIKMTFNVALSGLGSVALGNEVFRVTQIAILDPATQKLYLFVLRCESHCFRDNKSLLDQIVDSWTVKER